MPVQRAISRKGFLLEPWRPDRAEPSLGAFS
jgi:hypothetical protein